MDEVKPGLKHQLDMAGVSTRSQLDIYFQASRSKSCAPHPPPAAPGPSLIECGQQRTQRQVTMEEAAKDWKLLQAFLLMLFDMGSVRGQEYHLIPTWPLFPKVMAEKESKKNSYPLTQLQVEEKLNQVILLVY